jgi:hypothetical protein
MKAIWIFLFSSLLMVSAQNSTINSGTLIYYVPFNAETYTPLTMVNIKKLALYKFEVKNENTSSTLCDLTSGGKQTSAFDEKRIRLLIVCDEGKQQVFVDAIGNIFDGKTKRMLSSQNFNKLKSLLSELTKKMPI